METKGFWQLSTIEDANHAFLQAVGYMKERAERVLIHDAVGRILAKDAIARRYLPAADLSALDGYAVQSNDLQGASQANEVVLEVVGESKLGQPCHLKIVSGQAVAVATGSRLPRGADSVMMVEHTTRLQGNRVGIHSTTTPGEGVTRKGADFAPGRLILRKGRRLRPEDIGALKALGLTKVLVVRKVRVGILSTGSELVNSQPANQSAKIVDINRPIISAMVRELGAETVDLGIAKDEPREITRALKKGLRTTNIVLVTAGSSVGKRDLVPGCINSLGKPGMLVHGVAMRPAMPTGLAVINGKPIVSLPGFPVSAIVAFKTFVPRLLTKMTGSPIPIESSIRAVLKERISGAPNLRTFVRVKVERGQTGFLAEPLKVQRSSVLASMVDANGIVTIPESVRAIEAGEEVEVILVGDV